MALTKEDLQAIAALMDSKLEPINKRLDTMQDGIDALNRDMAHHNHFVEPLMKTIRENQIDHTRKLDKLAAYVETITNHEERIWALEHPAK